MITGHYWVDSVIWAVGLPVAAWAVSTGVVRWRHNHRDATRRKQ